MTEGSGLQLKPFQPISDMPSVVLGPRYVCRGVLNENEKGKEKNLTPALTLTSGCWHTRRGISPSSLGLSPIGSHWRWFKPEDG